jgi:hypothetical protein
MHLEDTQAIMFEDEAVDLGTGPLRESPKWFTYNYITSNHTSRSYLTPKLYRVFYQCLFDFRETYNTPIQKFAEEENYSRALDDEHISEMHNRLPLFLPESSFVSLPLEERRSGILPCCFDHFMVSGRSSFCKYILIASCVSDIPSYFIAFSVRNRSCWRQLDKCFSNNTRIRNINTLFPLLPNLYFETA